ncbi:GLPGLI family protein [Chryseobacterium daeguense]|uniref:GLPGLI family protein n=1 Tax=Chryseobacterium daeguense TaxID=412438 RepID=UPI00048799CD|nr:GLPGLI family protein [Chryseobacterium daeguense]
MKNLFRFCLFVFISISFEAYSQNYKVIYKLTYKADSSDNKTRSKNMVLELNKDKSAFYTYEFYKRDSIYREGLKSGKEVYQPMFDAEFSVIKNNDKSSISKLYNFPPTTVIYRLDEVKNDFSWKIINETKKINNYTCQKAQLNYKGRNWVAWFTKDIPLNFGPYVFEGLPGAILFIEDSNKNYTFELISIQKSTQSKIYFLNDWNVINVSKKEFTKISLDRYNDPYKEMRNDGALIEGSSGELNRPNINQMTKEKQEFIKRHNNPIEISDAIKYP